MKILRLVVISGLLMSMQTSPSSKKLRKIKRPRTTQHRRTQSRMELDRQMQQENQRTTICTPNVLRTGITISGFLIKGIAIIVAGVLQAVINK